MIVCYKNNFIFIKTKKVAGSSMETVLALHCGDQDIVTPLGQLEEVERSRTFPDAYPRNFTANKEIETKYREAVEGGNRLEVRAAYRDAVVSSESIGMRRHASSEKVKDLVGEEFWNGAYKFSMERHPYEKAISLAWWEARRKDFDAQLESVLRGNRYRNFDLYTIGGKLAVDFVIRFEHMADDTAQVEKKLGFEIYSRMPRSNSNKRPDKRPAREVLTAAQKAIVQETCREEFEMFGYEK